LKRTFPLVTIGGYEVHKIVLAKLVRICYSTSMKNQNSKKTYGIKVRLTSEEYWNPIKKTAEDREFEDAYQQEEERTHR
jgi:hypothetical protein